MLVRSDPDYCDIPVSRVCGRHESKALPRANFHVLRVGMEADRSRYSYVDDGDIRPSLCFPLVGVNVLDPMMYVSLTCTDMCTTPDIPVATERSRGLVLCVTLETFAPNLILARRVVKVGFFCNYQ